MHCLHRPFLLVLGLAFLAESVLAQQPVSRDTTRLRRPLAIQPVEAASEPNPSAARNAPAVNPVRDSRPTNSDTTTTRSIKQTKVRRAPDLAAVLASLNATEPYDVSVSGRFLVAADSTGALLLADAAQGKQLHQLEDSHRVYALVKISPDARWVVGVRADEPDRIDLWRADNGRRLRTIASDATAKTSLEFIDATLRVTMAGGNGVIYSIPAGEAVGGFQIAVGGSAVKQPSVSVDPLNVSPPTAGQLASPSPSAPLRSQVMAPQPQPTSRGALAPAAKSTAPSATARSSVQAAEPLASGAPMAAPMASAPEMAPMAAAPQAAPMAAPQAAPMAAAPMAAPQAAPMAAAPQAAPMMAEPLVSPQAAASPTARSAQSWLMTPQASQESSPSALASSDPAPAEVPAVLSPTDLPAETQVPPPPSEDLSKVTVHFATNRNLLTSDDRQWSVYFQDFFFSLPAVVLYALIALSLVVFPWFGKRNWAAAGVVTGLAVLFSMAAFEAYVRSQLRDELSGELYGSRPTALSYGTCQISVPKPENRTAGELNRPLSVWVFEAPENPEKHFVLQKVDEFDGKDEFFESLSGQLQRSEDGASLLFIHGYNVSFEDAIFRTAQLAVDLKFHGAPISFSWPSYADPVKYTFDEQNAEVSIPELREFLEDLATRSGAKRIHIIAHSMGNRVLAGALRSMSPDAREKNRAMFREIVMAAPDIDSRVFQTQVLPHIQDNTQHCTLYASSRDRALMLSRYFHNYQRLGETEPELVVANGMDTIDASMVDTSLLGHSYIGDVKSIVSDLHDLVVSGKRPTERGGLTSAVLGELMYWSILPEMSVATEAEPRRQ